MTSMSMNLGGCVHTRTAEECAKLAHTETQCAEYAHAQDREQLKTQTATECLDRACSDKQQAWILEDRQLWAALAERDFKCPTGLLKMNCETMTPAQAYRYLSTCQHRRSNVAGTLFSVGCGRPVFPGTPYCRDHCYDHKIILCRSCQTGLVNVVRHELITTTDPFCRRCMETGVGATGCQYRFTYPPLTNVQCGAPRLPDRDYCEVCINRPEVINDLLRRGQRKQLRGNLAREHPFYAATCSIPGHFVLIADDHPGLVIQHQDDSGHNVSHVVVGRIPDNRTTMTVTRADLIPLSEDDRKLMAELSLPVK